MSLHSINSRYLVFDSAFSEMFLALFIFPIPIRDSAGFTPAFPTSPNYLIIDSCICKLDDTSTILGNHMGAVLGALATALNSLRRRLLPSVTKLSASVNFGDLCVTLDSKTPWLA